MVHKRRRCKHRLGLQRSMQFGGARQGPTPLMKAGNAEILLRVKAQISDLTEDQIKRMMKDFLSTKFVFEYSVWWSLTRIANNDKWGQSGCDVCHPHWSPGLSQLTWLARWVFPSSLTTPCTSLPKQCAWWKRMTIPEKWSVAIFDQGYRIAAKLATLGDLYIKQKYNFYR